MRPDTKIPDFTVDYSPEAWFDYTDEALRYLASVVCSGSTEHPEQVSERFEELQRTVPDSSLASDAGPAAQMTELLGSLSLLQKDLSAMPTEGPPSPLSPGWVVTSHADADDAGADGPGGEMAIQKKKKKSKQATPPGPAPPPKEKRTDLEQAPPKPKAPSPPDAGQQPAPVPVIYRKSFEQLLKDNYMWAASMRRDDPAFFNRRGPQMPNFLWIGCCDSRSPGSTVSGQLPGSVFEMRTIANIFNPMCLSTMSILEYAVEGLHVENIIVCCHTNCGGVRAALLRSRLGVLDYYTEPIRNQLRRDEQVLAAARSQDHIQLEAYAVLSNAVAQAVAVATSVVVQRAWEAGRSLRIHTVIYNLSSGHLLLGHPSFESNHCLTEAVCQMSHLARR